MTSAETVELLQILNTQGQQFLESFSITSSNGKRKCWEDTLTIEGEQTRDRCQDDSEDEEWNGCDIGDSEEASEVEDDDFPQVNNDLQWRPGTQVMTLSAPGGVTPVLTSRAQMKNFMSPKVEKMRTDVQRVVAIEEEEESGENERTNAENDALLHRLVHTQLLTGSLKPDLSLTGAKRRKALAGRVLELSGGARLGKGEAAVRSAERNRAAPRVRTGISEKQKERGRQQLEQAKALGNYHPTIKRLFKPSEASSTRKRERGVKMGIGKFRGGTLKLSWDEIHAVQGTGRNQGHKEQSNQKRKIHR